MSGDSPAAILYDSGGTEVGTGANPVRTDPTGTTPQPVTDGGGSITVDGAVAVAGTVAVSNFPAVQPVSDNGGSLTVDGSVAVSSVGGTVAVSGPLTDTQLRATPVPVSGTVTANAGTGPWPVTDNGGSLTVDGPLTNTELRAAAVPVSVASLPLPAGAATETTLSAINTKTPALGQATMAASSPVVISSNQSGVPVTDNGGSLTVDGPLTNTELRASPVPTKELRTGAAAITSVTSSTSVQTLLAANANRLGATIYNGGSKDLWVKFGSGASSSSYTVKMVKDAYYEVPYGYTGIITGIWDTSPSGSALMTEMT